MLNLLKSRNFIWLIIALTLIPAMVLALLPATAGAVSKSPNVFEITKAEFIAKIADYFGWPHRDDYNDIWKYQVPAKKFNDVATEDKYGRQIEAAYEEGVISANANGNFYPESGITREDAAVILVNAFRIPESATPTGYLDDATISEEDRGSVYALVELGCMRGLKEFQGLFVPKALIKKIEVNRIFKAIVNTVTTPVYALPRQNYQAPRRYVKLYCADPDATIIYTKDGSDPLTSATAKVWNVAVNGYINEMLTGSTTQRDVVYKAYSMKDGLITSQVQTFVWHLYRPAVADFQSRQILAKTATRPAVFEIWNDSESVRAMAWYIEGQQRGILFDALQTSVTVKNLKTYIDTYIATKPYYLIIGHAHPDHAAQARNFINPDHNVYSNIRGYGSLRSYVPSATDQAQILNVDWGNKVSLGGCDLYVYALPGHANDNVILQDKVNGLIFASDIYGCTRAGSADNVNVAGVKVDLLLSLSQQTYSNYLKDGGKTTMLFTGHDESPLGDVNLKLFEAALQQVVDKGEAGCSPTLRGNNDAPGTRTTIIGDMWHDNTNWIALKLAGIMGDSTEYLTHNDQFNYNGADGFMKYSVLSNIEFEGAELVGTTVTWANPSTVTWAGNTITVLNSLPNMFDPWTYNYTIKVLAGTKKITVIPTTMSTKVARIWINNRVVRYRSRTPVAVSDGTVITIKVLAPDRVTTSTYTFTVEVE